MAHDYRTALKAKGVVNLPPYRELRSSRTGDRVISALEGKSHPIETLPSDPDPWPRWAVVLVTFIIAYMIGHFIGAAGQ